MIWIWKFISHFVFVFPLYMSFVWTIGALFFFFRRERHSYNPTPGQEPFFSILVPARNEEKDLRNVVFFLSHLDYPAYEVIIINDGSTDGTGELADELVRENSSWLRVIHLKPNSGKAKATNMGILLSKGELILVMDADAMLDSRVLKMMAWHFVKSPDVGAVTGNPRVLNRTSLLGKIQVGEYSSIIGLIKRTQRILGKVLTVSGVIAAFRREALIGCGLFDSDTVTEDIDMTWKLQKNNWEVRYEPRALCYILVPETLKGLWQQRVRWAQGGLQVMKKHADVWKDWDQRRFCVVYVEYMLSVLWSFCFILLIFSWTIMLLLYLFQIVPALPIQPYIPPGWAGSVLALVCLAQSLISLFIDSQYEKKTFMKYYFWIIWYPLFYWLISAFAVLVGFDKVFIQKEKTKGLWKSPDRGLSLPRS